MLVQYLVWLGDAVRGDFGESYSQRRPVRDILVERFPRSLELAVLTIAIAMIWAIPLGVISAVRQNTWLDYLVRVVSHQRAQPAHLLHRRPDPLRRSCASSASCRRSSTRP